MPEILAAVVGALVGAICTYVATKRLQEHQRETRRIKVSKRTFTGVPADGLYLLNRVGEDVGDWSRLLTVRILVTSFGNAVINNLKINASGRRTARLVEFYYWVDQGVKCERLLLHEEPPGKLRSEWRFVNPEDAIQLHLLFVDTESPEDAKIEIDAEGVEIEQIDLELHCDVPDPGI